MCIRNKIVLKMKKQMRNRKEEVLWNQKHLDYLINSFMFLSLQIKPVVIIIIVV